MAVRKPRFDAPAESHAARLTSKGQVTIPKAIRDELGLETGDPVLFSIHGKVVNLRKVGSLFDRMGSVPVPPEVAGMTWREITDAAWADRGRRVAEKKQG